MFELGAADYVNLFAARSRSGVDSPETEPIRATVADGVELVPFNESRWPPAAAVLIVHDPQQRNADLVAQEPLIAVRWLLPALEAAGLGVLVFGRPGRLGRAPTLAAPHRCHYGKPD